jgi:hypothetical protein
MMFPSLPLSACGQRLFHQAPDRLGTSWCVVLPGTPRIDTAGKVRLQPNHCGGTLSGWCGAATFPWYHSLLCHGNLDITGARKYERTPIFGVLR